MTGNQVTTQIMRQGVSFPSGIPTCWHYCTRGEEPRVVLCYELQEWGCIRLQDAPCVFERHRYKEVFTFNSPMHKWLSGDLKIEAWDQFQLHIG